MNDIGVSTRDRIAVILRDNRPVITAELAVMTIIQACGAVIYTALLPLFVAGWLSLWLRRSSWRQLGLARPPHWGRSIGLGILGGAGLQLLSLWLVHPLFDELIKEPEMLPQFHPLHGNILEISFWLFIGGPIVAIGEEMVYRGYLLNRFADLAGHSRGGWAAGLIGSSLLFGLGHAFEGPTGIFEAFLMGCLLGSLYFAARRNLWLPIIAHGSYNAVQFMLVFLGLYA
jgi:membrane protease YdiL (CAAX protease family)